MAVVPGSRLGAYEILSGLGVGELTDRTRNEAQRRCLERSIKQREKPRTIYGLTSSRGVYPRALPGPCWLKLLKTSPCSAIPSSGPKTRFYATHRETLCRIESKRQTPRT